VDFAFYDVFSTVTVTCPNLTRVDLVIYEWKISPFLLFFFPETVHTLGIRVNLYQIARRSLETLFKTIGDFLFRFPSVKTICFIDQHNVRVLRSQAMLFLVDVRLAWITDWLGEKEGYLESR